MKVFASFTGTLRELAAGNITSADLAQGYFMFGCAREHAFAPWKHTPNELAWFWRKNPEEGLRAHTELVNALIDAEMQERVIWRESLSTETRIQFQRIVAAAGIEVVR